MKHDDGTDDDEDLTSVASRAELAAALAKQAGTQRPWLVVVNGRSSVGRTFPLDHAMIIGRAPECDVHLDEDGISRRHARITRGADGAVQIEDLGSRNGTFVNGEAVATYALRDGDKIQVGNISILKFSYQDALDEALQKNLYESATRDPLTKIANKKSFTDALDREVAYAKRHRTALSLVMFDVDHFKRVNDTFGHPAGDHVLHALAQTAQRCIRAEDLVARVGGEEFAIILRGLDEHQAVACAERLRKIVESAELVHDGVRIPITISLGVAAYLPSHASATALVESADKLLYRAKHEGRNRVATRTPNPLRSSARMRAAASNGEGR